ncbi:MAG: 2-amino-4-hydroxy-6-hydroxymethyldihydropteridine diphosphokinase [Endomicrobium sp.]|jgi:2-amino-4-hydroxy-6-hydroxymethyldihydropteridine diphosphokinase|nr:2-amino-4-hydroxy-6-hydroxymethyldihydropteridine diphosphokinase [Endomicrobium sp.]
MNNVIYLGLGSNVGDRAENIIFALSVLQSGGFVDVKKISSFYETSPIGPKQRKFYNIAVKANASLNPQKLLSLIKQTESLMGRKKTPHWGPRVIDIDILFFNNIVIAEKNLTVPHKEVQNRLFVLSPLNEISRNFICPLSNKKINRILGEKLLTLRCQKVKILR